MIKHHVTQATLYPVIALQIYLQKQIFIQHTLKHACHTMKATVLPVVSFLSRASSAFPGTSGCPGKSASGFSPLGLYERLPPHCRTETPLGWTGARERGTAADVRAQVETLAMHEHTHAGMNLNLCVPAGTGHYKLMILKFLRQWLWLSTGPFFCV